MKQLCMLELAESCDIGLKKEEQTGATQGHRILVTDMLLVVMDMLLVDTALVEWELFELEVEKLTLVEFQLVE